MKKIQETIISEITNNNNLPTNRPKSLRPTPSLVGSKSLKPQLVVVRPIKIIKGPVVG